MEVFLDALKGFCRSMVLTEFLILLSLNRELQDLQLDWQLSDILLLPKYSSETIYSLLLIRLSIRLQSIGSDLEVNSIVEVSQ